MHEHIRIPRILWSQMVPSKVFVVQRNICEKRKMSMTWPFMAQCKLFVTQKEIFEKKRTIENVDIHGSIMISWSHYAYIKHIELKNTKTQKHKNTT
jgi:hypothetical protein